MSLCASDTPRKRPSKTVAVLLSCCLCLLVVCACLITTLVFVGRHILYNQPPARYVPKTSSPVPIDRLLVPQPRYQRLPRDTKPVLYDLTLLPDLAASKFEGWVNITINVSGFRKDLVIHSSNLSINEIKLVRSDSKELRVLSVNEVQEDQVLIITTREKILPDVYYLFIGFEGSLKDRLTGFYKSEYGRSRGAAR